MRSERPHDAYIFEAYDSLHISSCVLKGCMQIRSLPGSANFQGRCPFAKACSGVLKLDTAHSLVDFEAIFWLAFML